MVLPEDLRSDLKTPLGKLCKGNGLECIEAMGSDLKAARKIAAVGDMTAYYLLESGVQPNLIIVDHKTKRMQTPEHIKQSLMQDGYKTVEVVNPPATLTCDLLDVIKDSLRSNERIKIVVDGEEDLATLPVILYAPLGSVVIYGQPNEGSVIVNVTPEKKEQIKNLMNKMIVEE
ncbi:MAG: GTP-dependent dephospho-CoA kinase family protein [Methanotrichaceae archaeon]